MTFAPLVPAPAVFALLAVAAVLLVLAAVRRRRDDLRLVRHGVLVLLVALVGANPVIGTASSSSSRASVDIVFAVDTTASSAAEDYRGDRTRLSGMQAGARFAIVGFDRTTSLLLPLSDDAEAAATAVDVLRPEIASYSEGSRPDAPVEVLAEVLERARTEGRSRMLIYLGDGESTDGSADLTRFRRLAALVDGGAVLGYGTRSGGEMRASSDGSLEPGDYLRDGGTGRRVRSRADEPALRAIATELQVPYAHRTAPGDLRATLEVARARPDAGGVRISTEVERGGYWLFAIGACLLLLVELVLLMRPLRDTRALARRLR